jgi:hypothetical protein
VGRTRGPAKGRESLLFRREGVKSERDEKTKPRRSEKLPSRLCLLDSVFLARVPRLCLHRLFIREAGKDGVDTKIREDKPLHFVAFEYRPSLSIYRSFHTVLLDPIIGQKPRSEMSLAFKVTLDLTPDDLTVTLTVTRILTLTPTLTLTLTLILNPNPNPNPSPNPNPNPKPRTLTLILNPNRNAKVKCGAKRQHQQKLCIF